MQAFLRTLQMKDGRPARSVLSTTSQPALARPGKHSAARTAGYRQEPHTRRRCLATPGASAGQGLAGEAAPAPGRQQRRPARCSARSRRAGPPRRGCCRPRRCPARPGPGTARPVATRDMYKGFCLGQGDWSARSGAAANRADAQRDQAAVPRVLLQNVYQCVTA